MWLSGGAPQAPDALPALEDICALRSSLVTTDDMRIMPGSGLNAATLPPILRTLIPLGVREVHLSGGGWRPGGATGFRREGMGMGAGGEHELSVWETSEENVRAAREVCDTIWEELN